MDKNITSVPGYCVYEYLLVVKPHEALYETITALKREFASNYNAPLAHGTKPHITLVNFLGYEIIESRLHNCLDAVAATMKPFKVELSNFGFFPSHTVYINVVTKAPFKELVAQMKSYQRLMTLDKDHKPHFINESHLTICRKLKPWQFEQSNLEYTNRHFSGRFMAESMTLLKRPVESKKYVEAGYFRFSNTTGYTRQGHLFM